MRKGKRGEREGSKGGGVGKWEDRRGRDREGEMVGG